jgi:hypothetical protein
VSDSNSTAIRFCKKCQCETVRYKDGHCKPCANKRSAAHRKEKPDMAKRQKITWTANNKEQISAQKAAYYAKNRDKIRAAQKENSKINQERKKATDAKWKANNKERIRQATARRNQEIRDVIRAQNAAWRKANPDAIKIYAQNRRARVRACGGKLSRGISEKLFTLQRGKCACCSLPLGDNFHLDHIMPLALGGSNTDDNIQLLRQRCNNQKNAKHPVDFMQSRGFLL